VEQKQYYYDEFVLGTKRTLPVVDIEINSCARQGHTSDTREIACNIMVPFRCSVAYVDATQKGETVRSEVIPIAVSPIDCHKYTPAAYLRNE
jgi:hypothetical protein